MTIAKNWIGFLQKCPEEYNAFSEMEGNKYPLGTTIGPRLAVELTNEQTFWVSFKRILTILTI